MQLNKQIILAKQPPNLELSSTQGDVPDVQLKVSGRGRAGGQRGVKVDLLVEPSVGGP